MASTKSNKPGLLVCNGCRTYYLQKTASLRQAPQALNVQASLQQVHHGETIRQHVNAAQRGEPQVLIRTLGNVHHSMPPPPVPTAQSLLGPNVATPSSLNPASTLQFPKLHHPVPVHSGYQAAHQQYRAMRDAYARKAYSSSINVENITVQARMIVNLPDVKGFTYVHNIVESVPNIPVHIGACDLKAMIFTALLPQYIVWSREFPLEIGECELRHKNWVEIFPRVPDFDAIAERFFKFKGNNKSVKQFVAKDIEIWLSIAPEKYQAILEHLAQVDLSESSNLTSLDRVVEQVLDAPKGKGKRKKGPADSPTKDTHLRRTTPAKNAQDIETPEHPLGDASKKIRVMEALEEPSVDDIKQALVVQTPPGRMSMRSLFNAKTIESRFYQTPQIPFQDLIRRPLAFLGIQNIAPVRMTFSYNMANPTSGSFKSAYTGISTRPMFGGQSMRICVKQAFFKRPGSSQPTFYDGAKQAQSLTTEINCIGWAAALMDSVYALVAIEDARYGKKPPFEVPHLRFVKTGLAISDTEEKMAYLIEELIEKENQGWFVKYLNNDSPKPRVFKDEEKNIRARFLAFAQHVQFEKTKGTVFVSDFQGGRTLLTDPQIITSPDLSNNRIFADGNAYFDTFRKEHCCNMFCEYYGLTPLSDTDAGENSESRPLFEPSTTPLIPNDETPPPPSQIMIASTSGSAPMDISHVSNVAR